jgi:nucleoside-triphosphatase
MVHIFLTGNIQVGKTTIIRSFLSQTRLSADGFMTYWGTGDENGRSLYLSPYDQDLHPAERYFIACDLDHRLSRTANMADVFDKHGTEILLDSGKRDVIVMDELGFMESKAKSFQNAVMRHISGRVPILGVIKNIQTEFLNTIRTHPNVEICEITVENRDGALESLLRRNLR